MSDFERINAPRVQKIVDMLATIEKSARSNRCKAREVQDLLKPARDAMKMDMADTSMMIPIPISVEEKEAPTLSPVNAVRVTRWADIDQMVADLSPHELGRALARLEVRLSDYIFEKEGPET